MNFRISVNTIDRMIIKKFVIRLLICLFFTCSLYSLVDSFNLLRRVDEFDGILFAKLIISRNLKQLNVTIPFIYLISLIWVVSKVIENGQLIILNSGGMPNRVVFRSVKYISMIVVAFHLFGLNGFFVDFMNTSENLKRTLIKFNTHESIAIKENAYIMTEEQTYSGAIYGTLDILSKSSKNEDGVKTIKGYGKVVIPSPNGIYEKGDIVCYLGSFQMVNQHTSSKTGTNLVMSAENHKCYNLEENKQMDKFTKIIFTDLSVEDIMRQIQESYLSRMMYPFWTNVSLIFHNIKNHASIGSLLLKLVSTVQYVLFFFIINLLVIKFCTAGSARHNKSLTFSALAVFLFSMLYGITISINTVFIILYGGFLIPVASLVTLTILLCTLYLIEANDVQKFIALFGL